LGAEVHDMVADIDVRGTGGLGFRHGGIGPGAATGRQQRQQ
jgi:hypothetical protein